MVSPDTGILRNSHELEIKLQNQIPRKFKHP